MHHAAHYTDTSRPQGISRAPALHQAASRTPRMTQHGICASLVTPLPGYIDLPRGLGKILSVLRSTQCAQQHLLQVHAAPHGRCASSCNLFEPPCLRLQRDGLLDIGSRQSLTFHKPNPLDAVPPHSPVICCKRQCRLRLFHDTVMNHS